MAILQTPSFRYPLSRSPRLNPPTPISFLSVSDSKSVFLRAVGPGRVGLKTMTELVKTSASRGNGNDSGEESERLFQREVVIGGSSVFAAKELEATLNRLSKWVITALFGAVILWRHDGAAIWAAMGSIVNAILSVTLKRILNQERPVAAPKADPGMPSSHAQSIFFIMTFVILSFVEWLGVNESSLILSAFVLAFGSYLSWLRVSQRLHTFSQVAVGAAVGSIFSILWYCSWNAFVLDAFISSMWARIIVLLLALAFCAGFLLYVIRYWLSDE